MEHDVAAMCGNVFSYLFDIRIILKCTYLKAAESLRLNYLTPQK